MRAGGADRRSFLQGGLAFAASGLLVGCALGRPPAPQPTTPPRVGIILLRSREETAHFLGAFEQGLHDHGWLPGQTLIVEDRYADAVEDRLPDLAAELVRLDVAVLVAGSSLAAARAAKQATSTRPIVLAGSSGDPVSDGLIASLARPGGNVTGMASYIPGIWGKRLEILKEMVPTVTRVALLSEPSEQARAQRHELEAAVEVARLQLQSLEVRGPEEFNGAFEVMTKAGAEALLITSPVTYHNRARVAELALRARLPSISPWRDFALVGGLMGYDTNILEWYRRAGYFVDRILKGTRPADLPVEQPTKTDLTLNVTTAQTLGLTIPQSVLRQVSEVIQ